MFKFMVGAGKAAFMSVTEVIVVAEVDMVMIFFHFGWLSNSLALSETTEKDDANEQAREL